MINGSKRWLKWPSKTLHCLGRGSAGRGSPCFRSMPALLSLLQTRRLLPRQ
ncbi:unnamed protein product [Phytomonas sp. Hart1]|nr:unnamed protein product [Phytomonas sp. Hart1]|eukprot:CCW71316.1 unnamed protein product [Phytomonas sp. isolate Hart1]